MIHCIKKYIEKNQPYKVLRTISRRRDGAVVLVKRKSDYKKLVIKCIKKKAFRVAELQCGILLQGTDFDVCSLLKCFKNEKYWFLVYPYYNKGDLVDVMAHQERTEESVHNIIQDLYDTIVSLKGKKIYHRDLKMENIVLHRGVPTLIDFGFAHIDEEVLPSLPADLQMVEKITDENRYFMTEGYDAPEIMLGGIRDTYNIESAEVYALGAIAMLLMTGKVPLRKKQRKWLYKVSQEQYRNKDSQTAEYLKDISFHQELRAHCSVDLSRWKSKISSDFAQFLYDTLAPVPYERMTLKDLAFHPFLV